MSYRLLATVFILFLSNNVLAQSQVLYGALGAREDGLYTIDTTTAAVTLVGTTGFTITGMAWDENAEVLYGYTGGAGIGGNGTNQFQLITIDPVTAVGTLIGGNDRTQISDIAIDSAGNLYGYGRDGFFSIDTASGATTKIGDALVLGDQGTIAFDNDDNLFVTDYGSLLQIDPSDGSIISTIGNIPTSVGKAIAMDSYGTIFAASPRSAELYSIDPATAIETIVGLTSLDSKLDALEFVGEVLINQPPTSDAGEDQAIRAGDTVHLDGTASFDDNTATANLLFSWTISLLPVGSTASIVGADTATPSFVVDIADTYVIELVVTDQGALPSASDEVVVSADNLAPTAAAGNDQLVTIGTTVNLDGSDSSDPEEDALSYDWSLVSSPVGSAAVLSGADSATPTITPDAEGEYEIALDVSDPLGPGSPDGLMITAANPEEFAEIQVVEAATAVAELPIVDVTTAGNQQALGNLLINATNSLQNGDSDKAAKKLQDAIERTDGCILRGLPDTNGKGRDWITDCNAQAEAYALLTAALEALNE